MKIFTLIPALLLMFAFHTSFAHEGCSDACKNACKAEGKDCSKDQCSMKECTEHKCDMKACAKHHKNEKADKKDTKKTSQLPAATRATAAATGGTGYQINMKGMHCGSCAERITKALSTMPGLEANSVQVDVDGQKAFLVLKPGTTADVRATVTAKIQEAGYTVTDVTAIQ